MSVKFDFSIEDRTNELQLDLDRCITDILIHIVYQGYSIIQFRFYITTVPCLQQFYAIFKFLSLFFVSF